MGKAVIDYGFHVAVTDSSDGVLAEIPRLVEAGVPSFKLFMAYKGALMVDDATLLRVLKKAREAQALTWRTPRTATSSTCWSRSAWQPASARPKYHDAAASRPPEVEAEATGRADLPGHAGGSADLHRASDLQGGPRRGPHRPQPGSPGVREDLPATWPCRSRTTTSPAARCRTVLARHRCGIVANWDELWAGLVSGDLQVVATDHCPFNLAGQREMGWGDFSRRIPSGVPGIEHRLLLLHTLGVKSGRIGMGKLVDLFSTAPARFFGMFPEKGLVAPGSDADLVVFDPAVESTISAATQTQSVDYTPYEGRAVAGAVRTCSAVARSLSMAARARRRRLGQLSATQALLGDLRVSHEGRPPGHLRRVDALEAWRCATWRAMRSPTPISPAPSTSAFTRSRSDPFAPTR